MADNEKKKNPKTNGYVKTKRRLDVKAFKRRGTGVVLFSSESTEKGRRCASAAVPTATHTDTGLCGGQALDESPPPTHTHTQSLVTLECLTSQFSELKAHVRFKDGK